MEDWHGICGVTGKKVALMGRIPHSHVHLLDQPRQAPWSAAPGGGINLATFDSEVCPEGGRTGCGVDI